MPPANSQVPVAVRWWARGCWLVGNGPSYLLFQTERAIVTHLQSGLSSRQLRRALKGFQAFEDGQLVPLLVALLGYKDVGDWCSFALLMEIRRLIYQEPQDKIFEGRLGRFATLIRAARCYQTLAGPLGLPNCTDLELKKFGASDQDGHKLSFGYFRTIPVFSCQSHSVVADCACALWKKEQARWGGRPIALYRVPTRKELRQYLGLDEPAVTKLCRAEGFDWLPRAAPSGPSPRARRN